MEARSANVPPIFEDNYLVKLLLQLLQNIPKDYILVSQTSSILLTKDYVQALTYKMSSYCI